MGDSAKTQFDLIVIGGGSAGCIIAAEASKSRDVCLLEAGPDTERHPATLRADGYKEAFVDDALLYDRYTIPRDAWGGRRLFAGTGRGLGGSGSVNAMVYTRGSAADFDEWPKGWQWADVAPDFDELESTLRPRPRGQTQWSEAAIEAAGRAGLRRSENLNDGDLGNVLGYEAMSFEGDDRRSSYVAFLRPRRDRVDIRTGAKVNRLLFEGTRVIGVEYRGARGQVHEILADEVVLSAGALATPLILQRSGIGHGGMLQAMGIDVVCDSPEIGENLHDHPNVQLFFRGTREVDCGYPLLYGFGRAREDAALAQGQSDTCYVFYPARSSLREGMMRLVPGMVLPEWAYGKRSVGAIQKALGRAFYNKTLREFTERMWGIVVILGKPESRGRVRITSKDLDAKAHLDPGYLRKGADLETLVRGVFKAREIASSSPLDSWHRGEMVPGAMGRSRDALERWIRTNLMTTYHYAGTCRMGEDGPVDPATFELRGVQGVRVADASIMPTTPVSALNAPSMLIGLRAARALA